MEHENIDIQKTYTQEEIKYKGISRNKTTSVKTKQTHTRKPRRKTWLESDYTENEVKKRYKTKK